ncbi:MAG: tetratricopeptide repeat protein [Planctomycetaceae bacterium]|nr:tetratricopeptide repeat protein [Planctomycetaceae bacterium]
MWRYLLFLSAFCLLSVGCGSSEESEVTQSVDEKGATGTDEGQNEKPTSEQEANLNSIIKRTNKLLQVGNFRQAMDVISRAMVNHPENSSLYRIRAILHQKTGQSSSAMTDYTQAVQLDPNNAPLQDEVGFYLFSVGEVAAAQKHIEQAVIIDPQFFAAWNHLGLIQITSGELTKARKSLSTAIKIKPDYVDALINRGFAAYQLKQFDKALADYNAALKINPDAVNAHNNLGLIDYEKEDYQSAVANFTKCIMLEPKNPKYFEHRRMAYLKLGMNIEASNDANQWKQLQQRSLVNQQITRQPANAIGYLARAELAFRDGHFKKALLDFDRAVQLNDNLPQAWYGRAKARFELEEYNLVIDDCSRALAINPLQPIYSLRGEAFLKLGKIDQALEDFHSAKRLDPTVAEAFLKKAEELESLDQNDAAKEYRDKAKSLFPDLKLTPNAN